jgi:hypothetical protein
VSIAAALVLLARDWRRWLQPSAMTALLTLGALTCGAYTLLMVANIELIHYPQYALMTGVLLAGGNAPIVAWTAAVAAGVIDETYQHLVIYAGRADTYLEFNDMVLNAIGATWVVLLVGASRRPPPTAHANRLRRVWLPAVVLVAAWLALLWLDPPTFSPFWRRAATGRYYRRLSGARGIACDPPALGRGPPRVRGRFGRGATGLRGDPDQAEPHPISSIRNLPGFLHFGFITGSFPTLGHRDLVRFPVTVTP